MGIYTFETEAISVIPPAKLFKAFVVDADYLFPKVAPHTIQSAQTIEGDGGPGTIKKITFAQGSKFDYVKQRVDALDKEKFIYAYTIIEGDAIGDVMEKIEHEIKVDLSSDGGSILRSKSKYHTRDGIEIKEEQIKAGKERGLGLFKLVEAHLLANSYYLLRRND